ncbi:MAG: hypothetical protein ACRDNW_02315 [Trebonia sp.]
MFHGSNLHRKDNPDWLMSNATEIPRVPSGQLRFACGICVAIAWFIGLPRRAGARLHAMNDAESRWWQWQVSERHGGLTHQYRDTRFDTPTHRDPALRRTELTSS